jgi:hypothetical protein
VPSSAGQQPGGDSYRDSGDEGCHARPLTAQNGTLCGPPTWYHSGVLATVTTTAINCQLVPCIHADHPHRSGISALWRIAAAVALLVVVVWLRRRGRGDAL